MEIEDGSTKERLKAVSFLSRIHQLYRAQIRRSWAENEREWLPPTLLAVQVRAVCHVSGMRVFARI